MQTTVTGRRRRNENRKKTVMRKVRWRQGRQKIRDEERTPRTVARRKARKEERQPNKPKLSKGLHEH